METAIEKAGIQMESSSKLKINRETLENYLQQMLYKAHGDQFERQYGHYTSNFFPNCEQFWREFVVPLTERMDGYPKGVAPSINMRQYIDPQVQDIANVHYSLFINLVFAHSHLEMKTISSLESIYTHLGSVCDLAELLIEKWHLLLLQCQGKETHMLQGLSRDEFLEIAGKWYDEKYSDTYQYYLARGRHPRIDLISKDDLVTEYFGKESQSRIEYARHSQNIRQIRNVIVHDVKVARILEQDGKALIPKPNVINKYRSWREVVAVINNKETISEDFAEQYQQAKVDIDHLEHTLNSMWERLINDFREEFFSKERSPLRDKFCIELSGDGPTVLNIEDFNHITEAEDISASGTYYQGTALYHRTSDDKSE